MGSPERGPRKKNKYNARMIAGRGAFATVYVATDEQTGQEVAIKKVLVDERYKNRELEIMCELRHPNVVHMMHHFTSHNADRTETYLNLVLEYMPDTLEGVIHSYSERHARVPVVLLKLFMYQLCRSLAYVHSLGICHRDIKPQNCLCDASVGVLKLCDFGSAKRLIPGEANVAYICSRFYRAPELIFGNSEYSTSIDMWSVGCVMCEIMTDTPLFAGESNLDQLVKIVSILGTPTAEELAVLNPRVPDNRFPPVRSQAWETVLPEMYASPEAVDLVSRLLVYDPRERISAAECLVHNFFDELRDPATRLPDGSALPPLSDFSDEELASFPDEVRDRLSTHRNP